MWWFTTLKSDGSQKAKKQPLFFSAKKEELTEDEQLERSKKFMDEHRDDIKKYGMLHEYHDSEEFLMKNTHLACEVRNFTISILIFYLAPLIMKALAPIGGADDTKGNLDFFVSHHFPYEIHSL